MSKTSFSLNGVDVTTVITLAAQVDTNPDLAKDLSGYARRARVRWISGLHSQAYTRDVPPHAYDEPEWLGGTNRAMAASEALLGAIGGCIAVGFAVNDALREVPVHELEVAVEGAIDLPSFLACAREIRATSRSMSRSTPGAMRIPAILNEIGHRAVQLSPVVNTVRHPVDVQYTVRPIA